MATVSKQTSTSTEHVPATADASLADTLKRFEAAFNRQDPKEVASYWEEDGTLISPMGSLGVGRSGVETVYGTDRVHFLDKTRSTFEIQRTRMLGSDLACMDCDHVVAGARMPDGSIGTMRLHLVVVARRSGGAWRWLDARPYAFVPAPKASAMH